MVSKRDVPADVQHDHATVAGLIPLVTYVENLEREIHQNPSDERVAEIIESNFHPDLLVDDDTTLLGFSGFKKFNSTFRKSFFVLRIVDRTPAVFNSDKDGKGGVVGFTTSWLFEQKKDGALFDGDTIEIFEVEWILNKSESLGGHRMVTKAVAVYGNMNPIPKPRREKGSTHTKKIPSSRVSKRVSRSKVDCKTPRSAQ